MQLEVGALTDVGLQRQVNEDSILVNPRAGIFAVCDGVGGRAAGDRASRLAVETLDRLISQGTRRAPRLEGEVMAVEDAIHRAHSAIRAEQQRTPNLRGMATTVALVRIWERYAVIAHVGDCRVYLLRGEGIQRLTRDHSRVQHLVDRGELRPEEAENSPERNVITRSLGVGEQLPPLDIQVVMVQPDDTFLLGSDGMVAYVPEGEMVASLMERALAPQAACEHFKGLVYQGGAHDNLSVIIVRVLADRPNQMGTLTTLATPIH